MAIESKDAGDENDKSVQRWDGNALKLDDFDKRIARWCRKQYGTILGNQLWENSLPDVQGLHGSYWNEYCESVWVGPPLVFLVLIPVLIKNLDVLRYILSPSEWI